jgi:chromosome segregation ATPase
MIEPNDSQTLIGSIVALVMALGYWIRNRKPQEDKLIASAAADVGIIERLAQECQRLSAQNEILAHNLHSFQLNLLTFQTENQKLALENNALKEENLSLREEIMELRKEVQELSFELMKMRKPECRNCPY